MAYTAKNPKSLRVEWVFREQRPQLRSSNLLHPLRAELEIEVYGRDHFHSLASQMNQCRAMPISLFIDGFGIYRNTYRSLKAFYITLASLSYAERRKVSNMFTLTLGPDGTSFGDTVASFKGSMHELERGTVVEINGQKVLLMAFIFVYTGDMPQQAANSGFLGHQAKIGCRSCYAPEQSRGDLEYDVVMKGRYHFESKEKRNRGDKIQEIQKKKGIL
jgi:hypothetical protein